MCKAPPEIPHGRPVGGSRESYPVGSIVRYQCDAGYSQRHLPVIHCLPDGQWENPQVECTDGEHRWKVFQISFVAKLAMWWIYQDKRFHVSAGWFSDTSNLNKQPVSVSLELPELPELL